MVNQLNELKNEYDFNFLNSFDSYIESKEDILNTLKPYFRNKKNLLKSFDFLYSEYNTLKSLSINNESILHTHIILILNEFYLTSKNNKRQLDEILTGKYSLEISKAIQNYGQLTLLEINRDEERLDLFTKIYLKEIADILEGSILPYLKLLFKISYINKKINLENLSFGNIVQDLIKNQSLQIFLYISDFDININQIRNIAYHNSYEIVDEKIVCSYGKDKKLVLSKSQLKFIHFYTTIIYLSLKFAHTFYFMDNKLSHKRDNLLVSNDSLIIGISEVAYKFGFNLKSINIQKTFSDITLIEFKRYNDLDNNITEMTINIFMLLRRKVNFEIIPFFDKEKITFSLSL